MTHTEATVSDADGGAPAQAGRPNELLALSASVKVAPVQELRSGMARPTSTLRQETAPSLPSLFAHGRSCMFRIRARPR